MTENQTKYTDEFRIEAVRLLEKSGQSVSEVARHLGITEKAMYRWRQKYGSHTQSSSDKTANTSAPGTPEDLEAELNRLRRENDILRQERDVLKKAIVIISQQKP